MPCILPVGQGQGLHQHSRNSHLPTVSPVARTVISGLRACSLRPQQHGHRLFMATML